MLFITTIESQVGQALNKISQNIQEFLKNIALAIFISLS